MLCFGTGLCDWTGSRRPQVCFGCVWVVSRSYLMFQRRFFGHKGHYIEQTTYDL